MQKLASLLISFSIALFCHTVLVAQDLERNAKLSTSEDKLDLLELSLRRKKANEMLHKAFQDGSTFDQFKSYQELAQIDVKTEDYQESIKNALRALQLYDTYHWENVEIRVLHSTLSKSLEGIGAYSEAIHHQKMVLDRYPPNDKRTKQRYFNIIRLGTLYLQVNQYDSSLLCFQEGKKYIFASQNAELKAHSLNNIGLAFSKMGQLDSAILYYQNALNRYNLLDERTESITYMISIIKGNLAECLPLADSRKGPYFEADIAGSIRALNFENAVNSSCYYAEMLMRLNKLGSALTILDKAEKLSHQPNVHIDSKILLYDQFTRVYSKLGKGEQSLYYHTKQMQLVDSFAGKNVLNNQLNQYSNYEMNKIENELVVEKLLSNKKESQIEALHHKTALSNFRFVTTIVIAFLIVILSLFIIYKMRGDAKKKAIEQNLQWRLHQIESAFKAERLQRSVLSVRRKKEVVEKIMNQINSFENISPEQRNAVKMTLKNEVNIDNTVLEIEDEIHSVGEEFIAKLKINFPELNESDLKLLSLIKMKLTNKQIAEIKNIHSTSVKMAKNRLRKKLNLAKGVDFSEILNSY